MSGLDQLKITFFFLIKEKILENVDEVLNLMIKTLKKFSVEHSIALDYLQIFVNKLLLNTNKYIGDIIEKKICKNFGLEVVVQ